MLIKMECARFRVEDWRSQPTRLPLQQIKLGVCRCCFGKTDADSNQAHRFPVRANASASSERRPCL